MSSDIWQQCLYQLQEDIPQQQFNTWIRPLVVTVDDNELVISAPNRFVMEWVKDKYLEKISELVAKFCEEPISIVVGQRNEAAVRSKSSGSFLKEEFIPKSEKPKITRNISLEGVEPLVYPEVTFQKDNSIDLPLDGHVAPRLDTYLNPQYNFDTFVKGDSN